MIQSMGRCMLSKLMGLDQVGPPHRDVYSLIANVDSEPNGRCQYPKSFECTLFRLLERQRSRISRYEEVHTEQR